MFRGLQVGIEIKDLETGQVGTVTNVGSESNEGEIPGLNSENFAVDFHYPEPDQCARILFSKDDIGTEWAFYGR